MINYFKCIDDYDNAIGIFHATSPKNAADQALTRLIQLNKLQPNTSMNFKIIEYIQCVAKGEYHFKGTRTKLENKISLRIADSQDIVTIDNVSTVIELPKLKYDENGRIIVNADTTYDINIMECGYVLLEL